MDDRALYATILGKARPWPVERVELDDTAKAVHVWLAEHAGSTFTCPECQTISPLYDHVERSWGHLNTCHYENGSAWTARDVQTSGSHLPLASLSKGHRHLHRRVYMSVENVLNGRKLATRSRRAATDRY
jgi:hypothetical protein